MRRLLFTIYLFMWITVCSAQQETVRRLLDFYNSTDLHPYIEIANNNIQKSLSNASRCFVSIDSSSYDIRVDDKDIPKRMIPFICVEFKDMDSFAASSNIYDHIILDSAIVFVFLQVKNKKIKRIINSPGYGVRSHLEYGKFHYFLSSLFSGHTYHLINYHRLNRALRMVISQQPDCLLFCPQLGGDNHNPLCLLSDLLFIKKGFIYICRAEESKIYEIDEYAHRCLRESINKYNRNLEDWSSLIAPIWFEESSVTNYKAGFTPNEINIILNSAL